MGTWMVGAVVLFVIGWAGYQLVKDRKNGKGCGCGCEHCSCSDGNDVWNGG